MNNLTIVKNKLFRLNELLVEYGLTELAFIGNPENDINKFKKVREGVPIINEHIDDTIETLRNLSKTHNGTQAVIDSLHEASVSLSRASNFILEEERKFS